MNFKSPVSFALFSAIALSLPLAAQALQPITSGQQYVSQTRSDAAIASIPIQAVAQNIAASGTFVSAEHPTSGMARIVVDNGKRYLVLDSAFKTDPGPDLHVVLDPATQPPAQYQDPTSYVNLGKLEKVNGEQRYPIPAAVDVSKFRSVGIWCRMANATFGYASLR
ncbi:DM13 domain-containing protein [Myxacorys almedinensis]|uniref:Permease n=1 Tax=Myxacorys almedinensis A TaxID=2690445 RepID=A0A8J7YWF9_9CYAN|nr:DM13 domain-containing protein [Myxacorys almedinensis]NDJ15927.1 permease [Myxacorys almedinensis A]